VPYVAKEAGFSPRRHRRRDHPYGGSRRWPGDQ
jgi:hypothetical protein